MTYDVLKVKPACTLDIAPVCVREDIGGIVHRVAKPISFGSIVLLNEAFFIEFMAVIDFSFRYRCFATHSAKSFLFRFS